RSKTAKTRQHTEEIIVYLHPEARKILEKWGAADIDDYLFPCFRGSKNEIERQRLKSVFARCLNRSLRDIGHKLGFEFYLTLNLARHSYATKLNIDGVSINSIGSSLGHTSSATTSRYIKTLPLDRHRAMSNKLLGL